MSKTAVFVLPTSLHGQQGPVAAWINTAGWAAAARARYGSATIFTPEGTMTPEELRKLASQAAFTTVDLPSARRPLPRAVKTAVKDVRQVIRARRLRAMAQEAAKALKPADVPFVWQRHELFHTAGITLARQWGVPLVIFVAAPQVWEAARWGVRRPGWSTLVEHLGERQSLRAADVVACVSDEVAEVIADMQVPEERIVVTPSTVDPNLFKPMRDPGVLRRELGLTNRFVIGWVGSFRPFHGLDLLLDALAELRSSVPGPCLLLVGDGPERPRLQREVKSRGLNEDVRFTGTVSHDDLPGYLTLMDVAVALDPGTGSYHYSPLKVWEYLAAGRPVVAPNRGQVQKMLRNKDDALLVKPGDVPALCQALENLYRDPGLRERLSRNARLRAKAESWEQQLARVQAAIERVRGAVVSRT